MKKPSKFSNITIPANIYQKNYFYPQQINERYGLSKVLCGIQSFNLHAGIDMIKRRPVIITSLQCSKNKHLLNKEEKYEGICIRNIWKGIQKINGTKYLISVYEKKGIGLDQLFSGYIIIKASMLAYLLTLMIKLVQKIHHHKSNLNNFDSQNMFLLKQKNTQQLIILVCDMETIYKKHQSKGSDSANRFGNVVQRVEMSQKKFKPKRQVKASNKSDIQKITSKILEVQSNFQIHYENEQQKQSFQNLVKGIIKQSQKAEKIEQTHYKKWIKDCKIYFPNIESVKQEIIGKFKSIKQKDYKNVQIFCDFLENQEQQKLLSIQNQFDLDEMMIEHTLIPFMGRKRA